MVVMNLSTARAKRRVLESPRPAVLATASGSKILYEDRRASLSSSHVALSTCSNATSEQQERNQRQRLYSASSCSQQPLIIKCSIIAIISVVSILSSPSLAANDDDFFSFPSSSSLFASSSRFPFDLLASSASSTDLTSSLPSANRSAGTPFIWQPLPLRATFRPLNRQAAPRSQPPGPIEAPPLAPRPPRPPRPPSPPEPLALSSISERSISGSGNGDSPSDNLFAPSSRFGSSSSRGSDSNNGADSSSVNNPFSSSFFQPPSAFDSFVSATGSTTDSPGIAATTTTTTTTTTSTTTTSTTPTPRPSFEGGDVDDELPTRLPMSRFRPTRAPSDDEDTNNAGNINSNNNNNNNNINVAEFNSISNSSSGIGSSTGTGSNSGLFATVASSINSAKRIPSECFECICEASTDCNINSRCQTSDVRHTRCGMFLISYDQWLATGLSRELVTREALARDAAADERAFYECVTNRDCAERLLSIYLLRNQKDCDKDGRVDCYDMAAIHHSGMDQCAGEALLDSQYWNDFNACLGFGR